MCRIFVILCLYLIVLCQVLVIMCQAAVVSVSKLTIYGVRGLRVFYLSNLLYLVRTAVHH